MQPTELHLIINLRGALHTSAVAVSLIRIETQVFFLLFLLSEAAYCSAGTWVPCKKTA